MKTPDDSKKTISPPPTVVITRIKPNFPSLPSDLPTIKEPLIVAVDCELRGQHARKHGIVSLGWVVGSSTKCQVFGKYRVSLWPFPGQTIDPGCWDSFWMYRQNLFNALTKESIETRGGITLFRKFIDRLEQAGYPVILVSDCASNDFYQINYYLGECGLPCLNRDWQDKFRLTYDTESFHRGIEGMKYSDGRVTGSDLCKKYGLEVVPTTHWPDADAEHIYSLHVQMLLLEKAK